MADGKEECSICCENVLVKNMCPCEYPQRCDGRACRTCVQRNITSVAEPSCMFCKVAWSLEHLQTIMTKVFMKKEYRDHRRQFLAEQQKALFPATMPHVQAERAADQLRDRLAAHNEQPAAVPPTLDVSDVSAFVDKAMDYGIQLAARAQNIGPVITPLIQQLRTIANGGVASVAAPRWISRPCPVDTCRGFLSKAWKCGVCDMHVCQRCHGPKGLSVADATAHARVIAIGTDAPAVALYVKCDEAARAARAKSDVERGSSAADTTDLDAHVCNPNDAATAALVQQECKPCPKEGCGAMISKISGCDQMFCTKCLSAFSWRTGALVNGRIHNPHYFEYMRTHKVDPAVGERMLARERGDVPCGGLPTPTELRRRVAKLLHADGALDDYELSTAEGMAGTAERYVRELGLQHHGRVVRMVAERRDGTSKRVLDIMAKAGEVALHEYLQLHTHIADVEMQACAPQDMLSLRVAYLQGRMTDETFQTRVQQVDMRNQQNAERRRVWDMFLQTTSDTIVRLMVVPTRTAVGTIVMPPIADDGARIEIPDTLVTPTQLITDTLAELRALHEYANTCMARICDRYGCAARQIAREDNRLTVVLLAKPRTAPMTPNMLAKLQERYMKHLARELDTLYVRRAFHNTHRVKAMAKLYKLLLDETRRAREASGGAGGSASGGAAGGAKRRRVVATAPLDDDDVIFDAAAPLDDDAATNVDDAYIDDANDDYESDS